MVSNGGEALPSQSEALSKGSAEVEKGGGAREDPRTANMMGLGMMKEDELISTISRHLWPNGHEDFGNGNLSKDKGGEGRVEGASSPSSSQIKEGDRLSKDLSALSMMNDAGQGLTRVEMEASSGSSSSLLNTLLARSGNFGDEFGGNGSLPVTTTTTTALTSNPAATTTTTGVGSMLGTGVGVLPYSMGMLPSSIPPVSDPGSSQPSTTLPTRMTGPMSPPLSSLLGQVEVLGKGLGQVHPVVSTEDAISGPMGTPMSKAETFPTDPHGFPLQRPQGLRHPSLSPYGPSPPPPPHHPSSSFLMGGGEGEDGLVVSGERLVRPEEGGAYGPLGQGYSYASQQQHLSPGQHALTHILPPHSLSPHSLSPPHPSQPLPSHPSLSPLPHPSHGIHPPPLPPLPSHPGPHGPPLSGPRAQGSGAMLGPGLSPSAPLPHPSHGPGVPSSPHGPAMTSSPHHSHPPPPPPPPQGLQGGGGGGGAGNGAGGSSAARAGGSPMRDIPLSVQADDFVGFGLARGLPTEVILHEAGPVANLPLEEVVAALRRAHLHGMVGATMNGAGGGEGGFGGMHLPPPLLHRAPHPHIPSLPPHTMADPASHPTAGRGPMSFHGGNVGPLPQGSGPLPSYPSHPHPPPSIGGYPPISSPFSHPTSSSHGAGGYFREG